MTVVRNKMRMGKNKVKQQRRRFEGKVNLKMLKLQERKMRRNGVIGKKRKKIEDDRS